MLGTKFRYNPETLRYERVKISIFNTVITILSYLTFGTLFFAGLLLIQNYIIETPTEQKLRSENKSMQEHQVVLARQLTQSNDQLEELKKQELELYEKLFDTKAPKEGIVATSQREEILLSNSGDFQGAIHNIDSRLKDLFSSAKSSNAFFHSEASVKKEDLSTLFSLPSIIPIENFEVSGLVSGFGTRINPFHKGHYHHDGVDIATSRGTAVLAAGHGEVITTKRGDMLAGYGNYVEIAHGHGVITRYTHLEDFTVRVGQKIKKGQAIGMVGSSGGSIAPHLHYEVIKGGVNLDPIKFFAEGINAGKYQEIVTKSKKQNQSLD